MSKEGISFNPVGSPDPNDPRRIPAILEMIPHLLNRRPYIQWKLSDTIRMNGTDPAQNHPEVLDMLFSPQDARSWAQTLLAAANIAEDMADDLELGGSKKPKRFPPPPHIHTGYR